MHEFMFGVFTKGRIVFAFNKITCSHTRAAIIVGILDLAKDSLMKNHYFACDYIKKSWKTKGSERLNQPDG